MSRAELLGIGTLAVDRIRRVPRLVPAGAKGKAGPCQVRPGGATVNHLAWASALGVRTGFLGCVGRDAEADFMREAMDRAGIDHGSLLARKGSTAVSEIFVEPGGERAIYMDAGLTARITAAMVRWHWSNRLSRARIVSTDIAQMPLSSIEAALTLARRGGARVAVDLDVPPSQATARRGVGTRSELVRVLSLAWVLKPTREAAAELTGKGDALAAARALAARRRGPVVVTDGVRGAALALGQKAWRVPAFRVSRPVDATGAGDAFLGGFLAGLLRGLSPLQAARLASACGAVCVETVGAFPPGDGRARALARSGVRASAFPAPVRAAAASPARRALSAAARALAGTSASADVPAIESAAALLVRRLEAGGRLHVAGVGKGAFVAARAAATLASWGIPAHGLDVGAAAHGDLGQVGPRDALMAVSKSGETAELLDVVALVRRRGVPVVAVTGSPGSRLARLASVTLAHPDGPEGGPWDLAPMASLLSEAALLDALASELVALLGRTPREFADHHPGGTLGRKAATLARRR